MRTRMLSMVVAAGLLVLVGCRGEPGRTVAGENAGLPVVKVTSRRVAVDKRPATARVPATLQSRQRARIAARVSGMIVQLPVVMGSRVRKGDLLAALAADEIRARVEQARSRLAQAERNLQREERLLAEQASTPEAVKDLRDAVSISRAALAEARAMLSYTRIIAPFAGVITAKLVERGDLARPGAPLMILEGDGGLLALAEVPEGLAPRLRMGKSLELQVPAVGKTVRGRVTEISPAAVSAARTVAVKLALPATPGLRPGQFARLLVPLAPVTSIQVPVRAVHRFGQMERVFVVEEGRARLRLVRLGRSRAGQVEVLAGLAPGDRIVVDGGERLREGQKVQEEAGSR